LLKNASVFFCAIMMFVNLKMSLLLSQS